MSMNPTDIYEALDSLAQSPCDLDEFPFDFALNTDNANATVSRLRSGSTNKSDLHGGVLLNRKFHYLPVAPDQPHLSGPI